MTWLRWSNIPYQPAPQQHLPYVEFHNRPPGVSRMSPLSKLDGLAEDRSKLIFWLIKDARRQQASTVANSLLLLVTDSLLIAGLSFMAAFQISASAASDPIFHTLFIVGEFLAAILLVLSMLLILAGIFLNWRLAPEGSIPGPESFFFNSSSGVMLDSSFAAYQANFKSIPLQKFNDAALYELYRFSKFAPRLHALTRWSAFLLLVALFPYLLTLLARLLF